MYRGCVHSAVFNFQLVVKPIIVLPLVFNRRVEVHTQVRIAGGDGQLR